MTEPQQAGPLLAERLAEIAARRSNNPAATPATIDIDDRLERVMSLTENRIPARYRAASVTDVTIGNWASGLACHTRAKKLATDTLVEWDSLLLLGPTGVGKTHQAYGAIRIIAGHGVSVRWLAMPATDLFAQLRPRHGVDSEEEFRRHADATLLVVDDLGAAKGSEWTEEVTYRLINWRYERMLPTILASNIPPAELKTALGDRIASRLAEMCQRVVLKGADRRRT